jgi:putative transposase
MPTSPQPERRWLHHATPPWVRDATFFITLCCNERGRDQLCVPATSEKLLGAVRHYHEQNKWFVHVWLLMPDHAHALVACPREEELVRIVSAWKRYTVRNTAVVWQKGFSIIACVAMRAWTRRLTTSG